MRPMAARMGQRWLARVVYLPAILFLLHSFGCGRLAAQEPAIANSEWQEILTAPDVQPESGPQGPADADLKPAAHCTFLPPTLLWEPALANPLEPHSYLKPTTLSNATTTNTIDTAIGSELGLFRYNPFDQHDAGIQLDFFAVVFSRFADERTSVGVDYRFGLPITFAWGNWEAKVGYEHTSCHLGDQFMQQHPGLLHVGHVRDEAVVGLAYRFWNQLRLYGVFADALQSSTEPGVLPAGCRFDWGIEWSCRQSTGWRGQPYAAFDMEVRSDQDWQPNTTLQLGWQWKKLETRTSVRVAVELYNGDSPYGEFVRDHEQWVGLGVFLDF
jgi:Protein of unknown function (DUF1207)